MKQILSEEFRRMQKLAGLVTESEKYIPGKPHSSAIYPAGGAWHNLSTGKSIDLGEDPNHPGYEKLTPKEHKEVIKLLTNYIEEYEKNFSKTKLYKKSVVKGAEELIEKHKEKLAGTELGENISEANEDLFSKYKEKLEEFREEFVKDIKANKDKLKKLSNEDKKKLSKLIRDITDALDNTLPDTQ